LFTSQEKTTADVFRRLQDLGVFIPEDHYFENDARPVQIGNISGKRPNDQKHFTNCTFVFLLKFTIHSAQ